MSSTRIGRVTHVLTHLEELSGRRRREGEKERDRDNAHDGEKKVVNVEGEGISREGGRQKEGEKREQEREKEGRLRGSTWKLPVVVVVSTGDTRG